MRAAVVGCGGAGREHAQAYQRLRGRVELVGVCDVVGERAQRLAGEVQTRAYTRLEDMLAAERPDVVSVCSAEYHHVEPVLQALDAGCHVLCEKPLAHTVAEGRRMLAAAQAAGRVLAVDYNYRHIPAFAALRSLIAAAPSDASSAGPGSAGSGGDLGEVVLVQISAHAFCYHHALDLIRFLFGEVIEVAAWVDDVQAQRQFPWYSPHEFLYVPSVSVGAVLRTAGRSTAATAGAHDARSVGRGTTVLLGASRMRTVADTLLDIEVVGTQARLALRGLPGQDARPAAVEVWPKELAVRLHPALRPRDAAQQAFSLSQAFATSIAAFVSALQAGEPVPSDGRDGLAALEIDQAIVQAHRLGSLVRLSPS